MSLLTQRRPTYIIAEMACSHEGSFGLAKTIVNSAAQAGASAIQFQIWDIVDYEVPHYPGFDFHKTLAFSKEQWRQLADYVHSEFPRLEIIACFYGIHTLAFCESIGVARYKIHATDLAYSNMLKAVAATRKPIDLSVGATSPDEIARAIKVIRSVSDAEICLMYGFQIFPTRPSSVDLNYMMSLKSLFGLKIGYQDHCAGGTLEAFTLPAAAVGMGIDIIEKHITHDRALKGCDHESALNPSEFIEFVTMVRNLETALGPGTYQGFNEEELRYRQYARKSIVASKDIPATHLLEMNDLLFLRSPQSGLAPDDIDRLLGKKLKRPLKAYDLVLEKDCD